MQPISDTYLNIQVARASAVLPGAGAFDVAPVAMPCPGFEQVTLFIEYTRGGAGGDVQFKLEASPVGSGDVWHQLSAFTGAAAVSGADTVSNVQREEIEYGSTGAAIEKFTYGPVQLGGAVERLRVPCQESGAAGTPGTCKVTAVFS